MNGRTATNAIEPAEVRAYVERSREQESAAVDPKERAITPTDTERDRGTAAAQPALDSSGVRLP